MTRGKALEDNGADIQVAAPLNHRLNLRALEKQQYCLQRMLLQSLGWFLGSSHCRSPKLQRKREFDFNNPVKHSCKRVSSCFFSEVLFKTLSCGFWMRSLAGLALSGGIGSR